MLNIKMWKYASLARLIKLKSCKGKQMKVLSSTVMVIALSCSPLHAQQGPIASECKPDIARYCDGLSHIRGAIRLCLKENMQQVSQACVAALNAAGPRGDRRMQGGMGVRQILAGLSDQGYTEMRELELEDGQYELKANDPEGRKVEVYIDAITGEVLRSERDD